MNRFPAWVTRNCTFQNALVAGLILAFAVFFGVLCFEWIENRVSEQLDLEKKSDILKFVGIAMGGILVALQALASHRRAKALEDTAGYTEQGQRQERLKNAIEHLGHRADSVRLGGAYELVHLAEDTATLRQTVLDILCAHIRQTTGDEAYRREHESNPSEEIQSLLTWLFVQNHGIFTGCHINLQDSWLAGTNFRDARLRMANLSGAHLKEAKLDRAHLQRARLPETNLIEASLSSASLHEADFFCAHMKGACLKMARLSGANLMGASLEGAYLDHSYLHSAHLSNARLFGAFLANAQLQGANLFDAHLTGAVLSNANLQGAGDQSWDFSTPFVKRVQMSTEKETDLSSVWFGGIEWERVDAITEGLSDTKATVIRENLRTCIGKRPSRQMPEDSGAIVGKYTEEDAEHLIVEFEDAMSEVDVTSQPMPLHHRST